MIFIILLSITGNIGYFNLSIYRLFKDQNEFTIKTQM